MRTTKMAEMRGEVQDGSNHQEVKAKRTSFINILCKLQRGILIVGGVMFVIWFFITYGSQNYSNPSETIVAMKRTASSGNGGMEDFQEDIILSGMLKDHVIPIHYNLTLQLFMPPEYNFTTKGKVNILVECLKETKMIVLHARDLTVEDANITYVENYQDFPHQIANISQLPEKQLVFISFEEPLKSDKYYVLDISFSGFINNQSVGLYRSDYQAKDSNVSWIASSQFQPSDARRVFPCFDEPGMKATFEVHIIRKKDTVTLSNMPNQMTETIDDYWEAVSFSLTPRMSTYLLAFVVGDVKPYSEQRNRGVQIWSRSDMAQYGQYAYNITGDMLKFLSEYLEVPYPMPKTDLVAVPRFMHAAMENWGLITFTESALLYDPERSTTESKVFVTIVIAHELVHQWFGNLVTPTWWDHLWLNEGFASYYEYICVDAIRPEWNITYHFIGTIYEVMESDSLSSSRAMAAPVAASSVLQYFDEIAYLKGGAIVYMLQNFLGEKTFLRGLRNYLLKYSYKNTKEEHLFQNLNLWSKGKVGVQQVMKTWTKQAGYPVITIARNYGNKSAIVTQKAFVLDPDEDTLEEGLSVTGDRDTRTWIVPITYTNGLELDWSTKTDYWLKSTSGEINNLPDEKTWIIANIKQAGYFRVNYDIQNWEMLLLQLIDDHTVIHPINRAQIINDALNLARSETIDYVIALNLTKYLYHEEEYLPWQSAFSAFRYMDLMLSKTKAHKEWKEYVLVLMSPLYKSLGWTNDSADDSILKKYLRKNILKWSCNYGQTDCIETAQKMFSVWRNGTTSNLTMALDDREVVLCTGIAQGTIEDWELMWNRYLRENFKSEKNLLLKSLACTKEIKLLEKLLLMVLRDDGDIPIEDGADAIVYVAENFDGREVVYNFFKQNSEDILHRFTSFPFAGANIIDRLTAPLNTPKQVAEMENILKRRAITFEGVRNVIKIGLQRAKSNLHWMNNRYEEVYTWLKENPIE